MIYDSKEVKVKSLSNMLEFLDENDIKVPIAEIFTLDKINEAHKLMELNSAYGKSL